MQDYAIIIEIYVLKNVVSILQYILEYYIIIWEKSEDNFEETIYMQISWNKFMKSFKAYKIIDKW